ALGITTENPSVLGKIDRNARWSASSQIRWAGACSATIRQKTQSGVWGSVLTGLLGVVVSWDGRRRGGAYRARVSSLSMEYAYEDVDVGPRVLVPWMEDRKSTRLNS